LPRAVAAFGQVLRSPEDEGRGAYLGNCAASTILARPATTNDACPHASVARKIEKTAMETRAKANRTDLDEIGPSSSPSGPPRALTDTYPPQVRRGAREGTVVAVAKGMSEYT